jgi:hypothetical protein
MDNTTLTETLNAIRASIIRNEEAIELGEALKRLKENPDFISVIMEGYVKSEASKLFTILTDPSGSSPYSTEEILLRLEAISHFKGYVGADNFKGTVEIDSETAPLSIERDQDYRKELTAEAGMDN